MKVKATGRSARFRCVLARFEFLHPEMASTSQQNPSPRYEPVNREQSLFGPTCQLATLGCWPQLTFCSIMRLSQLESRDWRKRSLENWIIGKSTIEKMKRPGHVARVFCLFLRRHRTTA